MKANNINLLGCNCSLSSEPAILVYVEGHSTKGDNIGNLSTLRYSRNVLKRLKAILYVFENGFIGEYWMQNNQISRFGIERMVSHNPESLSKKDWIPDDGDDGIDSSSFVFSSSVVKLNIELQKARLKIMYDFLVRFLPTDPKTGEKCHSVDAIEVYVFAPEGSGQLMSEDITHADILSEGAKVK